MKKNIFKLYFLLFSLIAGTIVAQNSVPNKTHQLIDSLKNVLSTTNTDTTKVNALNQLSAQYLSISDASKSLSSAHQALSLAKKIAYSKGIGKAYIKIANTLFKSGNPDSALTFNNKALEIYSTLNDQSGVANCYNNIANIYSEKGDYQKSLEGHFFALKIRVKSRKQDDIIMSYINIGTIYSAQGNYEKAIEYFLKSLQIAEEISDKTKISASLNNIGIVYMGQKNYSKALDFFFQTLKIAEELNDKEQVARVNGNIGAIYMDQKIFDKAITYLNNAATINKQIGYKRGYSLTLSNIATVYSIQENYDNALTFFLEALKIAQEGGYKVGEIYPCNGIATIYIKQNKLNKAFQYLQQALKLSNETGTKPRLQEVYLSLADLFEKKGDYKTAYNYYKSYSDIKDTLLNEKSQKLIAEMGSKYDSEKKDKELIRKDAEIEKQQIETAKKLLQRNALIIGAGLLIIILFFIYRATTQKQKLNLQLEQLSIVASKTDNGVLICNPDGQIEWINQGLTRILGYTLDDLKKQGNSLQKISSNHEIKTLIQTSIEQKKSTTYETLSVDKNGNEWWLQSTLTPIFDTNGIIKKLVIIDTNITDRKKSENEIKITNEKIIDSISYAHLIQRSILVEENDIKKLFPNSFIFFKPKDIVSGDFYWFSHIDSKIIVAAVDCTGHGVPGAFMSMIGNTLLNQIINEKKITKPSDILELLHIGICNIFYKSKETGNRDGMDIALCCIDKTNKKIEFAGAQNPLYIVSKNEITIITADRKTIGNNQTTFKNSAKTSFTNHSISLQPEMSIYLFSDGYMDQFGGPERKKYGSSKFKELLLSNQHLPMNEVKEIISKEHTNWKNKINQIDDILVMGIRF